MSHVSWYTCMLGLSVGHKGKPGPNTDADAVWRADWSEQKASCVRWGFILTQHSEYDYAIRALRRCSLMLNYFAPVFNTLFQYFYFTDTMPVTSMWYDNGVLCGCSASSVCRRRRRCRPNRADTALSVDSVSSRRSRRRSLSASFLCAASSAAPRSSSWSSRRRRRPPQPRPGVAGSPRAERPATAAEEAARCRRATRLPAAQSWCSRCWSTRPWPGETAAAAGCPVGPPGRVTIIIFLFIRRPSSGAPSLPGLRPPRRHSRLRRRQQWQQRRRRRQRQ